MDIEKEARNFAIKAHKDQVRKSDSIKPMIIHPINVANILKKQNYDSNVVAAGYLHDVVEDTIYTEEDILKNFNADVASLVMGASEEDKTLSWEERKTIAITKLKTLDLRHKVVVCADKISNLEDIKILFEENQKYDFSKFNRGYDQQKWFYEEIYKSLIYNEDENNPLFIELKELIDYVFSKKKDNYLEEVIFQNNKEDYQELLKLHYKKLEIKKLRDVLEKKYPYVIEFTGTPRTGKTTLINNLKDFFKKADFQVKVVEEFTTSNKYKEEIFPSLAGKDKSFINTEIPKYILKDLNTTREENLDIIIIDRSLLDRLIWIDRLYHKKGLTPEKYQAYKDQYLPEIKNKINIIISTYAENLTSLKRDYQAHLSLEKRHFLTAENIVEYNQAFLNIEELSKKENLNFYKFDTTNQTSRKISFEIANLILDDMRKFFLEKIDLSLKEIYN